MSSNRTAWLAPLAALMLGIQPASPAGEPASGIYQIISGRYVSCCGIAGTLSRTLPDAGNAFVELTVDPGTHLARMKILGQDLRTVLSIPAEPCRSEFAYSFSDGTIFPDHIQFGGLLPPPGPDKASYSFVVSNSVDTLRIHGTVNAPCPGAADVPTQFVHTNVVAVLMPVPAIRVSEVEVCWQSASNRTYQVQYSSTLTTNAWVNLGSPVAGNGTTNCIPDQVLPGEPERFYRVLTLP